VQVPTDASLGSLRILTLRTAAASTGRSGSATTAASRPSRCTATSNTPLSTLVTDVADGAWRLVTFTASAGSTVVTVTGVDGTAVSYTAAFDLTGATSLVLGGERADGSQAFCPTCTVAGLSIAGDTSRGARLHGGPAGADVPPHRPVQLVPVVRAGAHHVGDDGRRGPHRRRARLDGADGAGVLQTLARTINGVAYVDGSGNVTLAAADVVRPATSAASLDIEQDLDATAAMPTLRRAADSRPTRVTISYAGGTTTLIDTAAEANNQPRREVKLDTCASDVTGATFAGSYLLQATNGLRITQVAVDLTTSVTNLWATFLGLYPTQKVTISGFDAALIGEATKVVFVQGWQVALDHESLVYTLDCSPASQFVSAAWDAGDEYGRWAWGTGVATGTGGTAMGVTSVGTLVRSRSPGRTGSPSTPGSTRCTWTGTARPSASTLRRVGRRRRRR
jgi:hypothetical protein